MTKIIVVWESGVKRSFAAVQQAMWELLKLVMPHASHVPTQTLSYRSEIMQATKAGQRFGRLEQG